MSYPATELRRRDEVHVGEVFHSSHGYRVLVTEVQDTAPNRTDERHVGLVGHIHASPAGAIRTERYPAGSYVPVEVSA